MDENANTDCKSFQMQEATGASPPTIELGAFKPPTVDWSSIEREIDVLFITVNDNEFNAVARIICNPQRTDTGGPLGPIYVGEIGKNYVSLVKSSQGAIGVAGAAATCQDAIEALKPNIIALLGVCFGLKRDKQSLGDLLIANQTEFYGSARINRDGSQNYRAPRPECAARLQRTFQDGKITWTPPGNVKTKPEVHFGLVLSGPKLIDNEEETRRLQSEFPEALGGEMEAEGIYSLCERKKIPWILCKAICDWGDGTKDKEWQPYAAAVSASFVQNVLEQTYLPEKKTGVTTRGDRRFEFEDKDEVDAKQRTPKNCKRRAENNNYLSSCPSLSAKRRCEEQSVAELDEVVATPLQIFEKRTEMDENANTDELQDDEIVKIARKLGSKWKDVALLTKVLDVHDTKNIADCKLDESADQKARTMLERFKEMGGTRSKLVNALKEYKLKTLAREVEQKSI